MILFVGPLEKFMNDDNDDDYYHTAFNALCVSHKDDESQDQLDKQYPEWKSNS